ncbi:DUF4058 family protein [Trichocoleus sp. FACHB-90]|uniref:DUF4058 family protein n=1 Tax=Cyanophyceae TaxID=3028117 RepID=UPI0016854825|nr:DUF4058 family protein [Trichocoleus sp. FACHB-90]MBD1926083.1 DUF4058 family protein [Trichocoleus sp. FACHB-90]
MPSPFPGVDPYLENPELWAEVHHRLITAIADAIAPSLRPKYRVAIEKRIYLSDVKDSDLVMIPDVTVFSNPNATQSQSTATLTSPREPITVTVPIPEETREGYLEIREVKTGDVITVIEILSPKNKGAGVGRKVYEAKRQQVLTSASHLVEIDLLRRGKPMPIESHIQADYRILVSQAHRRPVAHLYAFSVQEEIPSFPLPLQSGDAEVQLELQTLLSGVYDRAGFDLTVDYTQPAIPPLKGENAVWADALLREKGLR